VAGAVELVTGYISLVPSMQGAEKNLTNLLIPAAESAGDQAGEGAGKRFGGAWGKALLAAGVGAAVVGAFKGLYEVGNTFDDLTDTIRVGTGAQGDALNGLVDVATNVGKTVPAQFDAIGPVVADLNTRLGLSGETLQTVASQYLEAGRILGQEVDIATTTAAFSAFKIEGDAVSGAMDTLFQISQATGVGMNELASSVQANAPAMQNLGFSFEETASLVGTLDKAGLDSTATLSAMGKGLVTLAKDGEEPQEAFRRVTGEIEGLIASGDTAGAIDLASGIFGTRAANQFVGAVQSGTVALDDLVGGVGATSDTILGVGEETQDFAEKWQIVKNQAQAALEPIGSAVFATLGDSLSKVMPYLESFGQWMAENPGTVKAVAIGLGVLAVALGIAAAAQWAMNSAMLASPVTWIIVGIAALIAGLVLLIANWDTVVAWLKDVWGGIVDWLAGVWASITSGISSAWNAIASYFTGLWSSIRSGVESAWNAVVSWISGVPGRILSFFLNWTLPGLLIQHWGAIKEGAVNGFNAVVDFVRGVPGRILDALGNVKDLLLDAGKNILSGFLRGLTKGFEDVKDFVGGIGSWIADHKGPKAYDLKLLVPAGGWIMDGLRHGIEAEIPALRSTLGRVTDEISAGGSISTASRASARGFSEANTYAGPLVNQNVYPQPGMSEEQIGTSAGRAISNALVGVSL
jgi:phage-related minor tail protein